MVRVSETVVIPEHELAWEYARSGGPGGQNVNKVASKATLRWAMAASETVSEAVKQRLRATHPSRLTVTGEFLVTSQEYRDQERNRERCADKLGEMVRAALHPPKLRKATKPTKGSKQRRLTDKKLNSTKKTTRRSGWSE